MGGTGGWATTAAAAAAVLLAAGTRGQTTCFRYTHRTWGPSVRCGNTGADPLLSDGFL